MLRGCGLLLPLFSVAMFPLTNICFEDLLPSKDSAERTEDPSNPVPQLPMSPNDQLWDVEDFFAMFSWDFFEAATATDALSLPAVDIIYYDEACPESPELQILKWKDLESFEEKLELPTSDYTIFENVRLEHEKSLISLRTTHARSSLGILNVIDGDACTRSRQEDDRDKWGWRPMVQILQQDPEPLFLPPSDTVDENGQIEIGRLCQYCGNVLKTSRILNDPLYDGEKVKIGVQFNNRETYRFSRFMRESFTHQPSAGQLISAAVGGCQICTVICAYISHEARIYKSIDTSRDVGNCMPVSPVRLTVDCTWYHPWHDPESTPNPDDEPHGKILLSIQYRTNSWYFHCLNFLSAAPVAESKQPEPGIRHLLSTSTASDAVFALAKTWIWTCRTHHKHNSCRAAARGPQFRPTRLVYIEGSDAALKIRLETSGESSKVVDYIALSHCWGGQSTCTLNSHTVDELLQGIPASKLPRTFSDAVRACRILGKAYIWIDSLCIMQDSRADWAREAVRMRHVYANAYCTIAAACSRNSSEGFFRNRNPRVMHTLKLPGKPNTVLTADPYPEWQDLEEKPLLDRAWAFQERLLSPRLLTFDERKVSWECWECRSGEEARPETRNSVIWGLEYPGSYEISNVELGHICATQNVGSDPASQSKFFEIWSKMRRKYTKLSLTKPEDRLPAFHGITSLISAKTGCAFFDGLPVDCFLPSLLWIWKDFTWIESKCIGGRALESVHANEDGTEVVASSMVNTLSWASVEGEVIHFPHQWPFCAQRTQDSLGIPPPGHPSRDQLLLQPRQQHIQLSHTSTYSKPRRWYFVNGAEFSSSLACNSSVPYRYCTELIRLIYSSLDDNEPSRAILEGPIWTYTTKLHCYAPSRSMSSSSWGWTNPRNNFITKINRNSLEADATALNRGWFFPDVAEISIEDYMWRQALDIQLPEMDLTFVTIIEWEVDSYECAAGIALVKSNGVARGQGGDAMEESASTYSRVGYWELKYPRYDDFEDTSLHGLLRERSEMRRITII